MIRINDTYSINLVVGIIYFFVAYGIMSFASDIKKAIIKKRGGKNGRKNNK